MTDFRTALREDRALRAGDRREALPPSGGLGDVFAVLKVTPRPTPRPTFDGTPPAPVPGGFVVRRQGHADGWRSPPVAVGRTEAEAEFQARRFHGRRLDRSMPSILRMDFEREREFKDLASASEWASRAQDEVPGADEAYEKRARHAELMRQTNLKRDAAAAEAADAERRAEASKAAEAAAKAAGHLRRLQAEAEAAANAVVAA